VSLGDFCEKIQKIDIGSIEFHLNRGDFEAWFTGLGDAELAKKTALIRERKMSGEELRSKLYQVVKSRCEELAKIRQQRLRCRNCILNWCELLFQLLNNLRQRSILHRFGG